MSETIERSVGRFYGVYLLCSENPDKNYRGKCYIGFTVNPNRRINQHNRGKDFGGAKKTNNKGPWKMVIIVHGFPNNIAALQFEWAWQQPTLSTRLKNFNDLKRKQPKESYFQYNFRILARMLSVGPWYRLPLIIRWLEPEYECQFPSNMLPPKHMQIVSGSISIGKELKQTQNSQVTALWAPECHLCMERIQDPERSRIGCMNNLCKLTCHVICLANHLLAANVSQKGHYIPIDGECPLCETKVTWGALLQKKRKLQGILIDEERDESDDEMPCLVEDFIDLNDSNEDSKDTENNHMFMF